VKLERGACYEKEICGFNAACSHLDWRLKPKLQRFKALLCKHYQPSSQLQKRLEKEGKTFEAKIPL